MKLKGAASGVFSQGDIEQKLRPKAFSHGQKAQNVKVLQRSHQLVDVMKTALLSKDNIVTVSSL